MELEWLSPCVIDDSSMGVTVEHKNELYTLLVDDIGEVLNLDPTHREKVPGTIEPIWREFSEAIFQLEEQLMLMFVFDIAQLLRSNEVNN